MPQENVGLASFATKLIGSPSSAQRSLNILTTFFNLIYFNRCSTKFNKRLTFILAL
jgi:hypothetical protein